MFLSKQMDQFASLIQFGHCLPSTVCILVLLKLEQHPPRRPPKQSTFLSYLPHWNQHYSPVFLRSVSNSSKILATCEVPRNCHETRFCDECPLFKSSYITKKEMGKKRTRGIFVSCGDDSTPPTPSKKRNIINFLQTLFEVHILQDQDQSHPRFDNGETCRALIQSTEIYSSITSKYIRNALQGTIT